MAGQALEPRECPVCGCEFKPAEQGQRYCSSWCERLAGEQAGGS